MAEEGPSPAVPIIAIVASIAIIVLHAVSPHCNTKTESITRDINFATLSVLLQLATATFFVYSAGILIALFPSLFLPIIMAVLATSVIVPLISLGLLHLGGTDKLRQMQQRFKAALKSCSAATWARLPCQRPAISTLALSGAVAGTLAVWAMLAVVLTLAHLSVVPSYNMTRIARSYIGPLLAASAIIGFFYVVVILLVFKQDHDNRREQPVRVKEEDGNAMELQPLSNETGNNVVIVGTAKKKHATIKYAG